MITRTPNTFIVGAGPVATALAGALRLGGVPVLGLWARDPRKARAAAAASGVASFSAAPPDLLLEADVVILAVRDQVVAEVAAMLLATGLVTRHHIMLHCSGAMSASEALGEVADGLRGIGTLHPLRAIADGAAAIRELSGTVFGIEGDQLGAAAATILARAIGGTPLALSGDQMAAYHAAASIASNFAATLVDAASRLLVGVGIERDDALAALLPLLRGSVANLAEKGVEQGLTGPIQRGDPDTVSKHLEVLASDPDAAALYRVLGRLTVDIARRSGRARAEDLDTIEARLNEAGDPGESAKAAG